MSAKLRRCEHCNQVPMLGHRCGEFRVFCHWNADIGQRACPSPQVATGATMEEAIEAWREQREKLRALENEIAELREQNRDHRARLVKP